MEFPCLPRFVRASLVSAVVATSVAGCHLAIRDQAQVDPIVAAEAPFAEGSWLGIRGQPEAIVPNCRVDEWVERATTGTQAITCPSSNKAKVAIALPAPPARIDPSTRRTQVQAELMTYADQICDDHVAKIYANHSSLNFDFGFLTTLLSGGAAIATGRAATNLAAESALFSGTRSLVNSEVYYGYIGPAVMREIRALRSDLRTQISAKRGCSIDDYPPQEAINDALTYHDACSFSTGLASLLSKAGNTRIGEDKLRTAQLKATAAQLEEKKKALKDAQDERKGVDPKQDPERARQLDQTIAALGKDIAGLEGVLRFAGVVDPQDDAPKKDPELDDAKTHLQSTQVALATSKGAAKQKANAAKVADAQQHLDDVRVSRSLVRERGLQIEQLRSETAALSQQKVALSLAVAKAPSPATDAEIGRLDQQIQRKQKAIADKEAEQPATPPTVPNASSDIEFGIQVCKPPVKAIAKQ